jgi:hypothetical protein
VKQLKDTIHTQIETAAESFYTTETEYQTAKIGFFPFNPLKLNTYFGRQTD